jgi:glycosyltransferase involved in cell wall biosynthesis
MISVVMPYWRRPAILDLNLSRYRDLYQHADIEVVVVDDGSPEPAQIDANCYPWPVRVVRLPDKEMALNPCTAFNAGIAAASGNVLLLTNPEVVHRAPIIAGLCAELEGLGPKGYVAAACWGIKAGWWYCHSINSPTPEAVGRAPMPEKAGLHFCAMLHRSLYEEIGGFSEEYREGQGYEDSDLLWKLHAAGARFGIADHLVTDHHDCPGSQWPRGGAARNRAIFEARWDRMS